MLILLIEAAGLSISEDNKIEAAIPSDSVLLNSEILDDNNGVTLADKALTLVIKEAELLPNTDELDNSGAILLDKDGILDNTGIELLDNTSTELDNRVTLLDKSDIGNQLDTLKVAGIRTLNKPGRLLADNDDMTLLGSKSSTLELALMGIRLVRLSTDADELSVELVSGTSISKLGMLLMELKGTLTTGTDDTTGTKDNRLEGDNKPGKIEAPLSNSEGAKVVKVGEFVRGGGGGGWQMPHANRTT